MRQGLKSKLCSALGIGAIVGSLFLFDLFRKENLCDRLMDKFPGGRDPNVVYCEPAKENSNMSGEFNLLSDTNSRVGVRFWGRDYDAARSVVGSGFELIPDSDRANFIKPETVVSYIVAPKSISPIVVDRSSLVDTSYLGGKEKVAFLGDSNGWVEVFGTERGDIIEVAQSNPLGGARPGRNAVVYRGPIVVPLNETKKDFIGVRHQFKIAHAREFPDGLFLDHIYKFKVGHRNEFGDVTFEDRTLAARKVMYLPYDEETFGGHREDGGTRLEVSYDRVGLRAGNGWGIETYFTFRKEGERIYLGGTEGVTNKAVAPYIEKHKGGLRFVANGKAILFHR